MFSVFHLSSTTCGFTAGSVLAADRRWGHRRYRINEPIVAARQGLDKAQIVGRIIQRLSQPFYRGVDAVFEVHKGVGGPELFVILFARHHLARVLQQRGEDLEGFFLSLDLEDTFAQPPAPASAALAYSAGMVNLMPARKFSRRAG